MTQSSDSGSAAPHAHGRADPDFYRELKTEVFDARLWLDRAIVLAYGALAGAVFAFEELSRRMEARYSGVVIAAIVLAGLVGVSVFGDKAYFGAIAIAPPGWHLLLPGLTVTVATGLLGGLFARLMIATLAVGAVRGRPPRWAVPLRRLSAWRYRWPVRFAAGMGLAVALIGLAAEGSTFGSGIAPAAQLLRGEAPPAALAFGPLKFLTTWLTAWSGVPGGIFAPSLATGAGIGYDIAWLWGDGGNTALIAIGMTGFLAAVTQAPITSFLIVMEMINGRPLVFSLMAVAMLAAAISRMISRPLYATLAASMLAQFKSRHEWVELPDLPDADATAPAEPSPESAATPPAPPSP